MRQFILLSGLFLSSFLVNGQASVATSEEILKPAYKKAAAENKKVFIIFHASWCGWCRKMDASLNDPLVKKYFTDNFEIVHLTVEESAKNKHLENMGGWELKKQLNGEKAGLPFWVIMDENRTMLADSYIREKDVPLTQAGTSIGCPAANEEVGAFIQILEKTTELDKKALAIIAEVFSKNKPLQ